MLDDLEPTVRLAIMKILSGLYESGMCDEVDMSVIMQLFGVHLNNIDDADDMTILFDDIEFIRAYTKHKEAEKESIINTDFEAAMKSLDSIVEEIENNPDAFDVEIVDMATGESSHTTMTREEIEDLDVENPEALDELPNKPPRVLH